VPRLYPRRVATISVHTSPLEQPGTGDAGGLNVYVVEVAKLLAARGVELAQVSCPRGAPERPVSAAELEDKLADLAGGRLTGILADLAAPASVAVDAAGLTF